MVLLALAKAPMHPRWWFRVLIATITRFQFLIRKRSKCQAGTQRHLPETRLMGHHIIMQTTVVVITEENNKTQSKDRQMARGYVDCDLYGSGLSQC